ncbi:MAG: Copper-translocating P-type ATPase, partial [Candidatus Daviesbacteria bacterium GW2011_GWC1_40_9]
MSEIRKTFPIKGMHCASCVRILEKSLSKVEGVSNCVVNLATEQATVTYNPDKVTDNDLVSAVANVGYQAGINEELKTEDQQKIEKEKELKALRNKVFISLFLGGLIVWGSFPGLMEFAPNILRNLWVQFILAIPVQFWAGLIFYQATIPA